MIPLIKAECRMGVPRGRGPREWGFIVSGYKRVLDLQDEKNSVDGWWWWSHNDASVLKTTELYT